MGYAARNNLLIRKEAMRDKPGTWVIINILGKTETFDVEDWMYDGSALVLRMDKGSTQSILIPIHAIASGVFTKRAETTDA